MFVVSINMHTSSPSCPTSIIYVYQQLEVLISLNGNITMFNELSIGGLFGRAPNPAPSTTPARVLPNTSEVERLHPKDCESRKNGFACEKVEQVEPQKLAPPPPAQLRLHHFARSRSPPNTTLVGEVTTRTQQASRPAGGLRMPETFFASGTVVGCPEF